MIKILFFIETLKAGGAEKVMIDLVNHMDQTKFDITVQTVWMCDAEKYLAPGIRYIFMYGAENKVNHLRYRAEAESGLAYRLHIKDDYDIECAYIEMGPTKVLSASTNKTAKKLAWVHCDLTKKIGDLDAFVSKAASQYRKFDEIICVSENVLESFQRLFGAEVPARVIHNVVEDDVIREKAKASLPSGLQKRRFTVATLGRLTQQKGYDMLLNVHDRLMQEGFAYDLWIAGEGEDRPMLEQYIADHGLANSVKLLGFQENPYPILEAADLLVCSSRYEGLSTFVTEGLILGKPIVTTDCTGMRELLGEAEFGLITAMNEDALYDGMKTMLRNESLRCGYAQKAALRGQDFSTVRLVQDTEAYFMKLAGK